MKFISSRLLYVKKIGTQENVPIFLTKNILIISL
ncbi:hypothetical protein WEHE109879_01660 [Weissella hellenica]